MKETTTPTLLVWVSCGLPAWMSEGGAYETPIF